MTLRNAHVFGAVMMFVLAAGVCTMPTFAQSLDQRIADYRKKSASESERQKAMEARARAKLVTKLRTVIEEVNIVESPLRGVLAWYRDATGVPIVVNWRALERAGVDPDQEITVQAENLPCGQLLALIMKMASTNVDEVSPGDALIYEVTPWYVRIMTKSQANRNPVTRFYNVMDLITSVPDFEGPNFDLTAVLNAGIAEGGAINDLFRDQPDVLSERELQQQRGDQLAQLVADSIEPLIWQRNGGQFCSIRFHRGMLIVRAPKYVQEQIGRPTVSLPASKQPAQ